MLTVLAAVGVLVVIFVAAVVATRESQAMRPAPHEVADLALPAGALSSTDITAVRLGVTVRGYRMSEVDQLLDRLAVELAQRDATIQELGQSAPKVVTAPLAAEQSAIGASSMLIPPTAEAADSAPPDADRGDDVSFPDVLPAEPSTAGAPEPAPRD